MAYEITLIIDGKDKKFIRNEEPTLHDITNALKLQRQQTVMYSKDLPTDEDFDQNEQYLARFAVDFWNQEFTMAEVIDGATRDALESINIGVADALNQGKKPGEKPSPKKSRPRTSTKQSGKSTPSTTPEDKKATN